MARIDIQVKDVHGHMKGYVHDVGFKSSLRLGDYADYLKRVILRSLITSGFLKGNPDCYELEHNTVYSVGFGDEFPVARLQYYGTQEEMELLRLML
jgi:hypothetical protein